MNKNFDAISGKVFITPSLKQHQSKQLITLSRNLESVQILFSGEFTPPQIIKQPTTKYLIVQASVQELLQPHGKTYT